MRIVWRRWALADLLALQAYIARNDPRAAHRIAQRIKAAVGRLERFPEIGRPGRVQGTRELVVARTPYIVPYRVQGDEVQILRIYHAARRWPERL
ncbi:MAG: type II toxin-antitoxin system RelE/ParE family toxin [Geminicoccaceae bacterium]|jgi:toxin ParE1/3/4